MTLLVISPDYASHLLPLATLATAWRDAGDRVVVATGPATASIVASFGFDRVDLQLGRGSNPGVIRAEEQVRAEDESLRGFFDATRRGMVETLRYQADQRSADLLWEPLTKAEQTLRVVDAVRPDAVLVDHLAYSARLGLQAGGVPYADVVLGHPTALPVGDEVYGYPAAWPAAFDADLQQLASLRARCVDVAASFTRAWNTALLRLDPSAQAVADAFAAHGPQVLLNYPAELHTDARTSLLPTGHVFLGSAVRPEEVPPDVAAWIADEDPRPIVYVSFGSFLSARGDVLATVAEALRPLEVRVALAFGVTDPAMLGAVPQSWLVREYLPQVSVLRRAAVVVTHAGNNSVTEALTFGVPLLALPFSTDQFAGAAALVSAGVGVALAPNTVSLGALREAVAGMLDADTDAAATARVLGARLRREPGPARAWAALADPLSR